MSEFTEVLRAHLASVRAANDKPLPDPVGDRLSRLNSEQLRLTDEFSEAGRDIEAIRVFIAELERDIARRIEQREATKTQLLAIAAEIHVIRQRALEQGDQ